MEPLFVILPTNRPQMIVGAVGRMRRQSVRHSLIVVENGPAVGTCARLGIDAIVLTSDEHQSSAKNTAVDEVWRRGGGYLAFVDDDDEYSPGYLAEQLANVRRATVVGKRRHFVRLSDGLYLFDHSRANAASPELHGPSVVVHSSQCLPFRTMVGEDARWCADMLAAGATLFATSIDGYVYERRGSHTWGAPDLFVRWLLGDAWRIDDDGAVFVPAPSGGEVLGRETGWRTIAERADRTKNVRLARV